MIVPQTELTCYERWDERYRLRVQAGAIETLLVTSLHSSFAMSDVVTTILGTVTTRRVRNRCFPPQVPLVS